MNGNSNNTSIKKDNKKATKEKMSLNLYSKTSQQQTWEDIEDENKK